MIGVFGGAFNPIHTGHLLLAEYIREEFKLEKVVFVPAGKPPHKQDNEMASAQHRYNMVQLAISQNPFFEISSTEIDRKGTSYTSDTLKEMKDCYPDRKIGFICGADSIVNLTTWHNISEIFALSELIVAGRKDVQDAEFQSQLCLFEDQYNAKFHFASTPLIEISSTLIRKRLNNGLSIRYMVPDKVFNYIQLHMLY